MFFYYKSYDIHNPNLGWIWVRIREKMKKVKRVSNGCGRDCDKKKKKGRERQREKWNRKESRWMNKIFLIITQIFKKKFYPCPKKLARAH